MAILIDFSNLFFGAASMTKHPAEVANIILGKVRHINTERRNKYGQIVFCNDGGSWRKRVFPYYKARRSELRAEGDQSAFADLMKTRDWFWDALVQHGPWPCLRVGGAEGDDVMAALVLSYDGPHRVVSGDKDMTQLTRFENVSVWHPIKKKFVDNGHDYWKRLVLQGDPGDGVPNVLSDDDVFMNDTKRQTSVRSAWVMKMLEAPDFREAVIGSTIKTGETVIPRKTLERNFDRNRDLVDLTRIPKNLIEVCVKKHDEQINERKNRDLIPFFMAVECNHFITRAADFRGPRPGSLDI